MENKTAEQLAKGIKDNAGRMPTKGIDMKRIKRLIEDMDIVKYFKSKQ